MSDMGALRVTMVESNLPELSLITTTYKDAAEELRGRSFEILYESRTSILTTFQKELYEKISVRISKEKAMFLDPIVLSFAIRDACDLSRADYVWLDLEGDDEIANSVWTRKESQEDIITLAIKLLRRHLEKYILDAYDRHTREDLASVWEAQFKLEACPVCGQPSLKREPILTNTHKLRSWVCTNCGHYIMVQSDVLEYLLSK